MADYFIPTIIQPSIPAADMTPLERFVLGEIFEHEPDGDALYFFSEIGPTDFLDLAADDLDVALAQSAGMPSRLADRLVPLLRARDENAPYVELDLTVMGWEFIFQDIVRRSRTLKYVTAVSAFTCSKMRPDAFGGMAVLITADAVKGRSTHDILAGFIAELVDGPAPAA